MFTRWILCVPKWLVDKIQYCVARSGFCNIVLIQMTRWMLEMEGKQCDHFTWEPKKESRSKPVFARFFFWLNYWCLCNCPLLKKPLCKHRKTQRRHTIGWLTLFLWNSTNQLVLLHFLTCYSEVILYDYSIHWNFNLQMKGFLTDSHSRTSENIYKVALLVICISLFHSTTLPSLQISHVLILL